MRLWYASNETTFEEYTFRTGFSAAAGVGCYSWGPDNYTYAAFVNLDNALELWYKEKTDEDPEGWRESMTANLPPSQQTTSLERVVWYTPDFKKRRANKLTKMTLLASVRLPSLHPSTSLSLSNHFLALQTQTHRPPPSLQISKISWNGSTTSLSHDRAFSLEDSGDVNVVPGTHITALARFEGGVDTAFVYAQAHGDDVTEFSRALDDGEGEGTTGWRRRDLAREVGG